EGIIVHSEWSRARFAKIAPGVPVTRINMPVRPDAEARPPRGATIESEIESEEAEREVSIATFGLITPGKGIERTLRALSALTPRRRFRYTLVGAPNPYFDVAGFVRESGLAGRVTVTGHVTLAEFERRIAETDIAVNIRERTVGETSASLCRIMAAGVAAVVSNVGWYAELPSDSVVKLDLDRDADAMLEAYLDRLIEDAPLRRRIGANARRHVLAEHDIERSADAYVAFIREVIAGRARRRFVGGVSAELTRLGARPSDEKLMRAVAAQVALLAPPATTHAARDEQHTNGDGQPTPTNAGGDGEATPGGARGRTPKIEGVDYKRAAREYLGRLSEERRHHLRTKPFYNLAHKPAKYRNDGLDEDSHRHLCDFANMAVALALPPGSRVLDVGCGSGWLSEYFARLGYDVRGIDISPALVEMSRERVARVPYGVDHETPLRCSFEVHDIEAAPLDAKFDAVVCYDALHHFEDERAVFRHLAAMLDVGGQLFILEGERPPALSASEEELRGVMREFGTLESPFDPAYLRALLDENGLAVVGDYVSVNGLFERALLEGDRLPLTKVATDYHYLICKKVAAGARASTVPDSRRPGTLSAHIAPRDALPERFAPGARIEAHLAVTNAGDTLWLTGQSVRAGLVMPALRIYDGEGRIVGERHGPLLARAVAPGETVALRVECNAPTRPGPYTLKIDLVDQHVCWFEERGSAPLALRFEVG
ncbi:MAG TPA: methyltransferase domain-containing protein, partial [Pyrinomonadaceae bacterium]|nr:methyltransferase domain-containing protein [Pyrinomonadaceae bacterium]